MIKSVFIIFWLGFQLMKVQHMLLFQSTEPQLKDTLLNVIGVKNHQI